MPVISIRTKVFLLFSAAALLTMLPVLVLISRAVKERVYERADSELQAANSALRLYLAGQNDRLLDVARQVSLKPGIADQLLSGDTLGLRRAMRAGIDPRFTLLAIDSSGNTVAGPPFDTAAIALGSQEKPLISFPEGTEFPVRLAVFRVYTDSAVYAGAVGVAAPLDTLRIREFKEASAGTEIALVGHDSIVATTLPDSLAEVLRTLDLSNVMRSRAILRGEIERLPYLRFPARFTDEDPIIGVLLLRPVNEELAVAQSIFQYVVGVGATALLLSLGLALLVSRVVARPAQALASAASELARGNYGAPLPQASGDEVGQLTRAFGEMRSAIAERETRLRSAQAEAIHREKLAAMGRLVAQLSHEINNPIYNIQNCLEVLDRRGDPTDPNREFLSLAREELDRMAVLTRQLLDQSRPIADAARPVDLNQIATRVTKLAESDTTSGRVSVKLELEQELPRVVAHPDAMHQVMANLLRNALDAMPGGGTLRIETRSDATAVEAIFEDTGPGIEDKHLPYIFEAFYTTKPGVRGLGLGLFISEGIVRGHAGQLRVESTVGQGTRFIVRLPRQTLDTNLSDRRRVEAEHPLPSSV